MKHALASMTCAAALVVSLAACGGADNKATPPTSTSAASASTTATSQPATTPPTPVPTASASGPLALAASSTYTYGGLKVVVNLPADIPSASLPSLRLFSDFLQAVGRSKSQSKLDPSLPRLASAGIVKYIQSTTTNQEIGSVTYRIQGVQSGASGFAVITGCLDQSKLVQVRKDGSHFVGPNTKNHPTLKLTANISPGSAGRKVTAYTFALGSC
jgi:predicted small lipoprotein YifL